MQAGAPVLLTAAVFAHDEENLLHGSVFAMDRAAEAAGRQGLAVDRVLVLRGAAPRTIAWVDEKVGPPWRVIACRDPALGAARNALFRAAAGSSHVALLDGGDLCSENWLTESLSAAGAGAPAAWHPEIVIRFVGDFFSYQGYAIIFQSDVDDPAEAAGMLAHKAFHGGCVVPRAVFGAVPFPVEDATRGWGDVDWWWQCDVAGAGFVHRVRPGTFYYQRGELSGVPRKLRHMAPGTRIGPTRLSRLGVPAGPGEASGSAARRAAPGDAPAGSDRLV